MVGPIVVPGCHVLEGDFGSDSWGLAGDAVRPFCVQSTNEVVNSSREH